MRRAVGVIAVTLLVLVGETSIAGNGRQVFAVLMDEQSEAIPDFDLAGKLERQLLYHHDFGILRSDRYNGEIPPPLRHFAYDSLLDWGTTTDCRFVLYVSVDRREIVTKRQFSIPFVLNRYQVEGRIDGMFALLDIERGKLFGVWPLAARIPGPRQWQVNEDYKEDPDLFIPYPERLTFWNRMEEQAANDIMMVIDRYIHGR